ncbi:UrcA family protein [Gluconobacter sp. LMG 31484]|uniref:UrcA family protein n=1 Tax=Gluconobacter vitians TaxID=2728102 RepID=A0ABR9Y6T6_9PROT|nr:UrcA family protein [Gluconobacter vitians]MBF0859557.1 UrcA family protein [Gluconobacter vitians]
MTRFSTLLICTLSVASIALPLQTAQGRPADLGTASTEIDLSSLDLNSAQDWDAATKKIRQASHAVCQQLQDENWLFTSDVTDCEQDAASNARDSLYDLRDQQRTRRRNGHVLLALSARK